MGLLTREGILGANDLKTEKVDIPEWGGHIFVRSLTGQERDAFEAAMLAERGKKGNTRELNFSNLRAKLVALTAVDDNGARLFTDLDVEALGKKNASGLDRAYDVAQKLSGLKREDVEELTKNSEETPAEGSGSGSLPVGAAQ